MAVYMKVEDIAGDVSQKHHKEWIELVSVKLPTERPDVNTSPGNVTDRTTQAVDFQDVEIEKYMDKASPLLMAWNITGETRKVTIQLCKENGQTLLELILFDVILTKYESNGDEEGKVTENIYLDYTKIQYKYIPYKKDNTPGDPMVITYDLETAG